MYVLVFHIHEPEQFERIHGEEIVARVRDDLSRTFGGIADALLQHHDALTGMHAPGFGTWLMPFEMGHPEIEVDAAEQVQSITAAGKEMVRRMLQEELGMGVAVRTEFRLGVLSDDRTVLDGDLLEEIVRKRLEEIPLSTFAPPKIGREAFLEIVHARRIDLHLQPIISLETMKPVGFEALARGPVDSEVRGAGPLFGAASYYGVEQELDLACVATALEWAPRIPAPYFLSINMSPDLLTKAPLHRLFESREDPELMKRQVFEITEHLPVPSSLELHRAIEPFRRRGARLALDDAGCGFFNMGLVRALSPDIVKICITVVRRLQSSPEVQETLWEMVSKIKASGAVALGEGVEEPEQARILRMCGVELAQGFLFARPRPAEEVVSGLRL